MIKFNMTSIATIPTYENRTKGELDTCEGTLNFFTVQTGQDGEPLVSFVLNENNDNFYFASGKLKSFLLDNVELATNVDGCLVFDDAGTTISIKYQGKRVSKNNRQYNDWSINIITN